MSGPKTLTIGITVNLEHYENLRLEVNGEVQSQEDARDLASFLYDVLGTYGSGDPATKERIESFQKRVLPAPATPVEAQTVLCHEAICPIPEGAGSTVAVSPGLQGGATAPPPVMQTPPPIETPKEPDKKVAVGVVICEDCGTPVSQAEQKMSMLFTSRTLCRKCLKKV